MRCIQVWSTFLAKTTSSLFSLIHVHLWRKSGKVRGGTRVEIMPQHKRKVEEMMCFACFNIFLLAWFEGVQEMPWREECLYCRRKAAYIVKGVH